ncbi:collagen alpha-5(VI) chain-like [Mercenaria mercenaria]|uniref:collagen alpha-5(VI) chain-like n=1 Tax=Mercenaria mercenaria TaxID=6596 RepID=UPI00234EFE88|nr:collagen alpha-5(VI) chain-like [Mercenaria mercenaria]
MCTGYSCIILALILVVADASDFAPCGGKPADVFFALDSSGSLSKNDFQKELRFTEDVASMFDLDENKVRVGVISFSKTVTPHFDLGAYTDRMDMFRKISQITWEGFGTNTGEALNYLHTKGLALKNTRPGIPHIAIVLTDGMSQNVPMTLEQAKILHDQGITVFVIGIGSQIDKEELESIASGPPSKYVFMIDNFDALNQIKDELAIKACEEKPATPSPNIQNTEAAVEEELVSFGRCTPRHALDIVFAVDTAAIGSSNAKFVLQFIANISDRVNMAAGDTTIMTIGNGCSGSTLDEEPATDPNMVKQGLSTYQTPQFHQLMRNMRLKAADGRFESDHIGVLFVTDRLTSFEYRKAKLETMRAKFQRVAIFALGVGNRVDAQDYMSLTTNGGQYISVPSFEDLGEIGTAFLYNMCLFGTNK